MRYVLYGHSAEICAWVARIIPDSDESSFDGAEALGVVSDGRLIAGVVYDNYSEKFSTMELSIGSISPMWARKEIIRELLAYPFVQLGVNRCWAQVEASNHRAIKADKHIGFTQEAVLRDHFGPNKHGVILRMLAKDFRRIYENG